MTVELLPSLLLPKGREKGSLARGAKEMSFFSRGCELSRDEVAHGGERLASSSLEARISLVLCFCEPSTPVSQRAGDTRVRLSANPSRIKGIKVASRPQGWDQAQYVLTNPCQVR